MRMGGGGEEVQGAGRARQGGGDRRVVSKAGGALCHASELLLMNGDTCVHDCTQVGGVAEGAAGGCASGERVGLIVDAATLSAMPGQCNDQPPVTLLYPTLPPHPQVASRCTERRSQFRARVQPGQKSPAQALYPPLPSLPPPPGSPAMHSEKITLFEPEFSRLKKAGAGGYGNSFIAIRRCAAGGWVLAWIT